MGGWVGEIHVSCTWNFSPYWGNMFHVNTAVMGRGQGSISCARVTLPLTIQSSLSVNPETSMSQEHEYHEWHPSPVSSHSPNPKIIAAQNDHIDSPKKWFVLIHDWIVSREAAQGSNLF